MQLGRQSCFVQLSFNIQILCCCLPESFSCNDGEVQSLCCRRALTSSVHLCREFSEVLETSEPGIDGREICHIEAAVQHRRRVDEAQPDDCHTDVLQMVEPRENSCKTITKEEGYLHKLIKQPSVHTHGSCPTLHLPICQK